jgi:hypothetical protein
MPLPLLPHQLFGANCPGYVTRRWVNQPEFFCNTCDARFSEDEVRQAVLKAPAEDVICPFCKKANHIEKFLTLGPFICDHCGQGLA